MQYDEEFIISDLETLFKAELNTFIDCVNTEKGSVSGDPLFIPNIPTDKYCFETLNKSVNNYKGFFVVFGVTDTPIRDQQENNYIEDLTVAFEICTFDNGTRNMNNKFYQLLRYRRALKAVIMKNPDVFRGYAKPLVGSLKPTAYPYDKQRAILSIGIEIKASVTAN
jgi:hypothetical protein